MQLLKRELEDDFMKVKEEDLKLVMDVAEAIIKEQKNYIKELEEHIDDLQKALDVVLLNKCRTRKVKVKYVGKQKNVFNGHNR